jgi:hypothetical protein
MLVRVEFQDEWATKFSPWRPWGWINHDQPNVFIANNQPTILPGTWTCKRKNTYAIPQSVESLRHWSIGLWLLRTQLRMSNSAGTSAMQAPRSATWIIFSCSRVG